MNIMLSGPSHLDKIAFVVLAVGVLGGALVTITRGSAIAALLALVGTFCAMAGLYATLSAHFLAVLQIFRGGIALFYPCPSCRRGPCRRYGDYVWRVGSFYGYERWRVWRFKCRCGDQYIFDGTHFREILSDGTTRPYKKLGGFRKWVDDGC